MSSTNPKKRDAQSPLAGDDEDLKRRNIDDEPPLLIALDELSDSDSQSESDSNLKGVIKDGTSGLKPDSCMADKVDSLIGRMDRFMDCFATLHTTVSKNQRSNLKKFKVLESAHNELSIKVSSSTASTNSRIELLEKQLKASMATNTILTDRIAEVEEKQIKERNKQCHINEQQTRIMDELETEQGFITKNLHDCYTETKEKKMIISGVPEFPGEDTKVVALGCINKIIDTASALQHPDAHQENLKKLQYRSLDNVFRIGKARGRNKRNISVTFAMFDDKEMVYRAKMLTKDDEGIKFFINDDVSAEGRTLKSKLKRVVSVAKSQGKVAKLAGNKVIVDSRSYSSNELNLLPSDVTESLKQEKHIDDGIVYRGERSIFSNFFPAPFTYEGIDYVHVEQYYQHTKALHHNEIQLADRIMKLSKPLRIKVLGDGIDSNTSWMERRMMVLYDGVRAKFEQNWSLQEQLLLTEDKHLYEATTDTYFGCGIGFDSKRWATKNWVGENVAGLVVKKVRDELLGIQPEGAVSDNTLTEIASQEDVSSSAAEMETNTSIGIMETNVTNDTSTTGLASDGISTSTNEIGLEDNRSSVSTQMTGPIKHARNQSMFQSAYSSQSYNNADAGVTYDDLLSYANPSSSQSHRQRGRGRGRGRARGRGRGRGRGFYQKNNQRLSQNNSTMSSAERSFLGIKSKKDNLHGPVNPDPVNASSPKQMVWAALSEEQKTGLAKLGLTPGLLTVNNNGKWLKKQ